MRPAASSSGVRPPMHSTASSTSQPGASAPSRMGSWSISSSCSMLVSEANPPGASSTSTCTFLNQRRGSKSVRLSIISSTVASMLSRFSCIERAALGIALGELQSAKRHLVEIVDERPPFLQAKLGLIGGFRRIADQRALIEALRRRERRLVAEQHLEKVQALDMTPEHHEAHGERHGEQQAERPPQPGPEHGGENDRDRRETGAVAVDERLDHLAHDELGDEEQRRPSRAPWSSPVRPPRRAARAAPRR